MFRGRVLFDTDSIAPVHTYSHRTKYSKVLASALNDLFLCVFLIPGVPIGGAEPRIH